MGHRIDKAVIIIAAALIMYSFFYSAAGSIPAAMLLTFISMCLLKKILPTLPKNTSKKRMRFANAALEQLSLMNTSSAEKILRSLPELSAKNFLFLQFHPSRKTTADDIAAASRALSEIHNTTIVTLSTADRNARSLASKLTINLIDGPTLAHILSKHPELIPQPSIIPETPAATRLQRIFAAAQNASSGKCALTGAFMCLLFFTSGAAVYLTGGCLLIFIAAVSFRSRCVAGQ